MKVNSHLAVQEYFQISSIEQCLEVAKQLALQHEGSQRIRLGLQELLMNALEHGNLGLCRNEKAKLIANGQWLKEVKWRISLPENRTKHVVLSSQRYADKWVFDITDQGQGFDWQYYTEREPNLITTTHGRGILIAKAFCFDSLEYHGCGNRVTASILLS